MRGAFATRLTAGAALLVGLAFLQAPGLQVADTKFDLVADPAAFLSRALHLWDPTGIFGQLQNQAYGYLWPMGPFFLVGDVLGAPGWAVQRAWLALVLVVAFLGAALVARALGLRSDLACLLAGGAYALSPRMLATLGPISVEAWPGALVPWVLLPLVLGASRGSAVRAAAWSALAIGAVGGVNAAATAAVLPLGALWLLTRPAGARRRAMMLWWPVFTFLATAWWLVPLFLLGAYSPPFLDVIESAGVTTFPATPFDVLRGSSAWIGYVDLGWGGGTVLVRASYLALNSGIVLALGLAGLALRSTPHRRFLALGLLAGVLLTSAGHVGATAGWGAASVQDLLDGALAPLRNVHKFDPVVRLPMVLGLAALVEHAVRRRRTPPAVDGGSTPGTAAPTGATPLVLLTVIGVVGAAVPVVLGQLPPSGRVQQTPSYWSSATQWLDARVPGTTFFAPGTSFGTYRWGSPRDEPFQYLDQQRWAVRNAVPLTPAGTVRYLDSVETRLARGEGSQGLTRALARAGVGAVVVRNDLAPGPDVPDARLVRQALTSSPGLRRVRGFGPVVGGEPSLVSDDGRLVVNGGWQDARRALEVFVVDGAPPQAISAADPGVLVGGPEDVLDALDEDLLSPDPTVLALDAADARPARDGLLLTDGLQDRERSFGRVHEAYGPVRTPGTPRRTLNRRADVTVPGSEGWRTRAELRGARSVTASGSASDAGALGGSDLSASPYAALDDDPDSAWRGAEGVDGRVWWQVDLDAPATGRRVVLEAPTGAPDLVRVRVLSDSGESRVVTLRAGGDAEVVLPAAPRRWLRVEEQQPRTGRLALTTVSLPGLDVGRTLVLPDLPAGWPAPDAMLLRRLDRSQGGCVRVDDRTPCREAQVRAPEERLVVDRTVRLPRPGRYAPQLSVRGLAGPQLEALLQEGQVATVAGSSTGPDDLRASALAAVDGDPGTTWTPSLDDEQPALTLRWARAVRVRGLTLGLDPDAPARAVRRVALVWPEGRREAEVEVDGVVDLGAPVRTSQLEVRVLEAGAALSVTDVGTSQELPPGVGELTVTGAPTPAPPSTLVRDLGCGSGPTLLVGRNALRTSVVASPAQVVAGGSVDARVCGGGGGGAEQVGGGPALDLPAGPTRLVATAQGGVTTQRLVLRRTPATGSGATTVGTIGAADGDLPVPLDVTSDPASRSVRPAAGDSTVVLRQNLNPGWVASQDGAELTAFAADGWQQAWTLAGDGPVRATYAPDTTYRVGLVVGGGLALLLLLALLVPLRRWPRALRREHPPVAGGRWDAAGPAGRTAGRVAVLVAAGLVAGWPSVLVVGAVLLAGAALHARPGRVDPGGAPGETSGWHVWVAPSLVGAVATAYALRPWGGDSGWAGELAWTGHASVVAIVLTVLLSLRRSPREPSSSAGTST